MEDSAREPRAPASDTPAGRTVAHVAAHAPGPTHASSRASRASGASCVLVGRNQGLQECGFAGMQVCRFAERRPVFTACLMVARLAPKRFSWEEGGCSRDPLLL